MKKTLSQILNTSEKSLAEIARDLNVSVSAVSYWHVERSFPRREYWKKLESILKDEELDMLYAYEMFLHVQKKRLLESRS